MDINKIAQNFHLDNKAPSLNQNKQKVSEDNEDQTKIDIKDDIYDLDLIIKDLPDYANGVKETPSRPNCAQSEWSRCSCTCETKQGATCVRCEETKQGPTCFGPQCRC